MEQRSVLLLLLVFTVVVGEELPTGAEDFDTILTHIGFGKWNVFYYIAICCWRLILPAHAIAGAFFSPYVNHTCRLPAYTPESTIIPPNSITFAAQNATINSIDIFPHDACSYLKDDLDTGLLEEVPCTEWDFDNSTFSTTVTSEFNLVCERQYLRATYQSIYMGGFLVGAFLNGYLAYRFGRLRMIIISQISYSVMALGSAWLPSLESLLVFRFLLGIMHPTSLLTGFILVMETTEVKRRSTMAIFISFGWGVGTMLYGLFGYLERDWRWLQIYVSLLGPVMLPFLLFLNESPRWLVVKGRHKEALSVLRRAARLNKTSLPPNDKLLAILKKVQEQSSSKDATATTHSTASELKNMLQQVSLIFSTRKLVTITVVTSIGYFSVAMIFFGLNLAATAMGADDPFTFMVVAGVVELPAAFGIYFMEKFGRRKYGIFIFALCSIALLLQPLVPDNLHSLSITLGMIGKMASASAFCVLFLFSSELYPTEVRTQGMGFGMMCSRVGAFLSPYIMSALEPNHPWAISVVFGLVAAVASVSFVLLWETVNTCLPDTITQMEGQKADAHTLKVYKPVPVDEETVTSA